MEIIINTIGDLKEAAKQLIAYSGSRKKWCFQGEMGAGKTTFIKIIGTILGIQQAATSPTYSLINEYTYQVANKERYLYHLDLYRLNRIEEALDIGIEEYLDNDSYCFIEWPALIMSILPDDALFIKVEILEDSNRKITFE